jgi:cystathionine beta-synthase
MVYNNILETVGNTPLVRLNSITKDIKATVYAKVETFNPGHSIKDRMALQMIEDAENEGLLKPGGTIIEGTSGNTGMGLAMAATIKGYKCIFVIPDKQSKEKIDALKAFGAEVVVTPTAVEPEDPRSYYSVSTRLANEVEGAWKPNQYDNLSNSKAHYKTTGPEIWEQTKGKITHLVVGVGTGGTISGTGKYLKEQNPNVKIWGIDSYGSLFKSYHETGEIHQEDIYPYVTEGIGEDFVPKNVNFDIIDHFEKVTDRDSAIYTKEIVKQEGIWVGNSAGAVIGGLLQMKDQLKEGDMVVVIFHDHGTRYVGKFFNDDWMRKMGYFKTSDLKASHLVEGKGMQVTVSVEHDTPVAKVIELMEEHDISQLPVKKGGEFIGSIDQLGLLNEIVRDKKLKEKEIGTICSGPYPIVPWNMPIEEISTIFTKIYRAVLTCDNLGDYHMITKIDVLEALAK